jgi:predicted nucleic acid-binding protein
MARRRPSFGAGNPTGAYLSPQVSRMRGCQAFATMVSISENRGANPIRSCARPQQNLAAVEQFRGRLEMLPFVERAANHCGQLRAELERAGQRIGLHDMMIGGHARSEALTMATNDAWEFQCMPGLIRSRKRRAAPVHINSDQTGARGSRGGVYERRPTRSTAKSNPEQRLRCYTAARIHQ